MSAGRGFWATAVIVAVIVVIAAAIGISGCGKSSKAEITEFKIGDQAGQIVSAAAGSTINVKVPYSTILTKVVPTIQASPNVSITPDPKTPQDFSNPVIYTVKAQNGKEKVWTVNVTKLPNTEAKMTAFSLPQQAKAAVISEANHTVDVELKYGTDLSKKLITSFKLSEQATSSLAPGDSIDFSAKKVIIKVKAGDGSTTQDWTIKVSVAEPTKTIELTKVVLGGQEAAINTTTHTVRVELPEDVPLNSVILTELTGAFGKVKPALAVGDTLDFSKGAKTFTFAAQDIAVKTAVKWKFLVYHPAAVADSAKVVIGKGEGVEHAFIRQLLANPIAWGFSGSLTNRATVRKWAEGEAHRIAIKTGYVDYATGKEIRVLKAGTVYQLAKNDEGNTVVYEYASFKDYKDKANVEADDENVAAPSLKEAKFAGADQKTIKKHVQSYEYVFTPVPCPSSCPPAPASGSGTGGQQPGGSGGEINFPTTPVMVWPAEMPI